MTRLNLGKRALNSRPPTLVLWNSCFALTFFFQTHQRRKVPFFRGEPDGWIRPSDFFFCFLFCFSLFLDYLRKNMGYMGVKIQDGEPGVLWIAKSYLGNQK